MAKLPKPVIEPTLIHIPELGPEYANHLLPIGARDWTEFNHHVLNDVINDFNRPNYDFKDITGQRFGKLVAIKYAGQQRYQYNGVNKAYLFYWCKCDCGSIKIMRRTALLATDGHAKSCGCKKSEVGHGYSQTKLYSTWQSMNKRCYLPTYHEYPRYGARGITVCDEWNAKFIDTSPVHPFLAFRAWAIIAGYPADESSLEFTRNEYSLDRVNNDGNYCPDNCAWRTARDQALNRSNNHVLTVMTYSFPIAVWSDIMHIGYHTIRNRLLAGWTEEEAVLTPVGEDRGTHYAIISIPLEYEKYNRYDPNKLR
ncbi:MAG: hypothetical protein NC548_05800 [Lachnospiraceae bacterium]|nr:hypothetical protein [Lachnospiraceae bacterium]